MSKLPESGRDEIVIQGVPASPGIVLGKAYVHTRVMPAINHDRIDENMVPVQLKLFKNAKKTLRQRWKNLMQKESGKVSKAILSAQMEIISDPELTMQVESLIKNQKQSAQQAIDNAFTQYIELLADSGNDVMKNRMIDLTDIRDRLVETAGDEERVPKPAQGEIFVAKEVSPREVIQLSHRNVRGFVMEQGGHTSHAAIIARSMGLPAVVGANGVIKAIKPNSELYINGSDGIVAIHPGVDKREQARGWEAENTESIKEKISLCQQSSQTTDSHSFTIRANIEFPEELENAQQFGAEGIGLLRTESMYINREDFENVEEQIVFYEQVVSQTKTHPVTIRLFDVGGDKFQGADVDEQNPFLGWRGIRMLLDKPKLLRRQLKAILTIAGRYPDKVKILVPMVSRLEEIKAVKAEIEHCTNELQKHGAPVDSGIPVGMMVEIPSAAIHADHFAKHVDFFSIGTNDLTQYLLAVDRGNALISELYNQCHPSVWKVIEHVLEVAEKHNTEVEICGELASYPVAAACLVGMGARNLSMSPVSIPSVKKILIHNSLPAMQQLSDQVLLCDELDEVQTIFRNWKNNSTHA